MHSDSKQKKYRIQYEYINKPDIKYVILDPSKKYSIISLKRLEKDGIEVEDMESENIEAKLDKLELNLLIGREKLERKILVYVSEELNEEFYLGNDFLSSYSIEKDNAGNYILKQEIRIEEISDTMNKDDDDGIRRNSKLVYFIIPLIIASFVIVIFNYQSISTSTDISSMDKFNFDEFIKHTEKLEDELYSFELSSNEMIKRKIIDSNILANRIGQSVAFKNTGSVLVDKLNAFSKKLEIAKSSYIKIYSDGTWFFWNFEQCVNKILFYISNKSLVSSIQRKVVDREKINLLKSVQDSIEALRTFYSSVDKAHEVTLTAESLHNSTHNHVIKAKEEIHDNIPSSWYNPLNYIYSTFYTEKNDNMEIATKTESFLITLNNDLRRDARILKHFKENLDKHIGVLHKFSINTESLKHFRWNEDEINKISDLLNTVKMNHKKIKSKVD